jgi:hypothetical protein
MKQYQVLFGGENVWTIDGKPHTFNSRVDAAVELYEHFKDMEEADIDYEPSDYEIEEITD